MKFAAASEDHQIQVNPGSQIPQARAHSGASHGARVERTDLRCNAGTPVGGGRQTHFKSRVFASSARRRERVMGALKGLPGHTGGA